MVREELYDEDIYAVYMKWERRQYLREEDVAPMLQEIMAALDVEPDIYAEVYAHAEDRCRMWATGVESGILPRVKRIEAVRKASPRRQGGGSFTCTSGEE
jgi:hypothetical protein